MRDNIKNIIGLLLFCSGILLAICAGVSAFRDMAILGYTDTLCKILLGAALVSFAASLLLLVDHGRQQ